MKLTITTEDKQLIIEGDYSTFEEIIEAMKAMLNFLSFSADSVMESIAEEYTQNKA